MKNKLKIAIIGLGYVGLPLAIAFAKKCRVVGFDKNINKINEYKNGIDVINGVSDKIIKKSRIFFSSKIDDLIDANVYIITVPTPVNTNNNPDITDVVEATTMIGKILKKDDTVIYESTFYPGMTEEICIPLLEKNSNMKQSKNFYVGYSPERINPGDKKHKLENTIKLISGIDEKSRIVTYDIYKKILNKKLFLVSSIKVAESAKILENTQRDVNIALMNNVSKFFKKIDVDMDEVLNACYTKWNFAKFRPGLVGGHCIGVDPYYLLYKADKLGVNLNVIKECRIENENMKDYIYDNFLKKINEASSIVNKSIIIYGVTFKENVSDYRNSKIIEIAKRLYLNNYKVYIEDKHVNIPDLNKKLNTNFLYLNECKEKVQGIIIATPHDEYKYISENQLLEKLENKNCPIFDLNNIIKKNNDSKVWRI